MGAGLWIVDIDGTVADCSHRRHFVEHKPANWAAFNGLCTEDPPIEPVIRIVKALFQSGDQVCFVSGRSEDVREQTQQWLDNQGLSGYFYPLYMRSAGDSRTDWIVKSELLEQIKQKYDVPIVGVIDDRPQVVKFWRESGLFVLDVNQTGKDF